MSIDIGEAFPDFELENQHGKLVTKGDFTDFWLVVYFYPQDDTRGCTIQGKAFTETKSEFDELGAKVVGVSQDSVESHCDFYNKFGFSIDLLADTDHKLIQAAGIGQTEWNGNLYWDRTTFVVDPSGLIKKVYYKVEAEGHESLILNDLKLLKN